MKRSAPLQRRTRLRPVSPKKLARRQEERAVRERVFARDRGCVLQRHVPHRCRGPLTTPHHVIKSAQGGPYEEGNLVQLCWWANSVWVETHRAEAEALGLHKPGWTRPVRGLLWERYA